MGTCGSHWGGGLPVPRRRSPGPAQSSATPDGAPSGRPLRETEHPATKAGDPDGWRPRVECTGNAYDGTRWPGQGARGGVSVDGGWAGGGGGQVCIRRDGGGLWDPKFVYQKRPNQIFLPAKFVFPTMVALVWRGGGGGQGRVSPLLLCLAS